MPLTKDRVDTIGSYFGEWCVCWLGGWTPDRLSYVVMVVRVRGEPKVGRLQS